MKIDYNKSGYDNFKALVKKKLSRLILDNYTLVSVSKNNGSKNTTVVFSKDEKRYTFKYNRIDLTSLNNNVYKLSKIKLPIGFNRQSNEDLINIVNNKIKILTDSLDISINDDDGLKLVITPKENNLIYSNGLELPLEQMYPVLPGFSFGSYYGGFDNHNLGDFV